MNDEMNKADLCSLIDKWNDVKSFLENVFNSNPPIIENRIQDEVLLFFINKLSEFSGYLKAAAESQYETLEEEDAEIDKINYYKELEKQWNLVYQCLKKIPRIKSDLEKDMLRIIEYLDE
jgi:hypothetical protein